jgi:membrane associated rhomboid family serine protease
MFLLPLNDVEPNRYTPFPFMVGLIIIANLFILIAEDFMVANDVDGFIEFLRLYGTTPALILGRQGAGAIASITSVFLHGGFLHWFFNMLGLWVYGRRVEDACGPWRFLAFYLLCGVGADVLSTLAQIGSTTPGIGASGAVYGVMGAYLVLFPTGRIRTVGLLLIIPFSLRIPAILVILYFLAGELVSAFDILLFNANYQIGHWAHLGGFFAGLFVMFFLRPDAFHRYRNDLPL